MANAKDIKYDLEERTSLFAERIIELVKTIQQNLVSTPIINQLIKSGTSVRANYFEANGAESRKDFIHKMGICRKESKETKYWL